MMAKTDIEVQVLGEDGNVFAIIGRVRKALWRAGENELAKEYTEKAMAAESYDKVLQLTIEYVEVF